MHTYIPTHIHTCTYTYLRTCIHADIQTDSQTDTCIYLSRCPQVGQWDAHILCSDEWSPPANSVRMLLHFVPAAILSCMPASGLP